MLDPTQEHDFPIIQRAICGGLLNGVARWRFYKEPQTSFAPTEIRDVANESIRESRRSEAQHQRQNFVRSRRRMILEGLISNFFAGWDVGVSVDSTVKAATLRWFNLGFNGSTNWML